MKSMTSAREPRQVSFEVPEYTGEVDAIGTLRFLDAIKETGLRTALVLVVTSFGILTETAARRFRAFETRYGPLPTHMGGPHCTSDQ
jgi:GDP-D-mannose dehydratase